MALPRRHKRSRSRVCRPRTGKVAPMMGRPMTPLHGVLRASALSERQLMARFRGLISGVRVTATLMSMLGFIALPGMLSAEPIRIVDTGPSGPVATRNVDWNMQWVAAEFSASSAWRITGVEGWIVPFGVERLGGSLRIGLLNDGGG